MKDKKNYHVPKDNPWSFDRILNKIGYIIGLYLLISLLFALSSCGSLTKLSDNELQRRAEIQHEIDILYTEYKYKTDSLWIQYYRSAKEYNINQNK